MSVHSTAIISEKAKIGNNVKIGPFVVIEGEVVIGDNCVIEHHSTIGSQYGVVELGCNNHLLPNCVIGGPPQDLSYDGEKTKLKVGNNNIIREFVTINTGTVKDKGITEIGNDCLLMAYVHIAHDCWVGDKVVIANSTQFAGHVEVSNDVKIGGGCLINQFIKIGEHAYIAGDSAINKDILPFTIAQGRYAIMRATNKIGLSRFGFEKDRVENIHKALKIILRGHFTKEEAIEVISETCLVNEDINYLLQFYKDSERGIAK